jgi:hypothetical protein
VFQGLAADICICEAIASRSGLSDFQIGISCRTRRRQKCGSFEVYGASLIPVKERLQKNRHRLPKLNFFGARPMSESKKTDRNATSGRLVASVRPVEQNPVSAVRLPTDLTADVDAWASIHAINRSEAIRRLIERGLKLGATANAMRVSRRDAIAVEQLAVSQIDQFIDPRTPPEERDRRIHRLTEGPPEFVDIRIDLPKR